jgi:hypothetical protein
MTEVTLDAVREDNETALSRLGSSKALYAATGGELDGDQVLRAAADDAAGARDVFSAWADDEPDEDAAVTFAAAAERTGDQLETALGELDGYDPGTEDPLAEHLRAVSGTAARAGALLGWSAVSDETLGQVVGFFVGDADPMTASTFRDVRGETGAIQERALELLESIDDRETAKAAADAAVEAAYDDYVATLEGMGVNPKDVC